MAAMRLKSVARASLGYQRIVAGHFVDNPASGRVLEKLGFRRTGSVVPQHSIARNREVDCIMFELDEEDMLGSLTPALAA
jgi:RimJ/RimL family protein N-acetyltransferase